MARWPRDSLIHDTGLPANATSSTEFSIGHNMISRQQVNDVMASAEKAGAHIIKPAQDAFWGGYSGYFQDLDGHLWEVVWNPAIMPQP